MDTDIPVNQPDHAHALSKDIVLFDGVCNLCHGAVNFIIDRDPAGRYHFASLQSEPGRELLQKYDVDPDKIDSVVLVRADMVFTKSRAALEISRYLRGPWPLLYVFKIVPSFIADAIYDLVARNRYKWFGKQDQCRMPDAALRRRFIA
ncbi:thiol-disulfide oxidoreductase DCC family protein [Roseivirga sp. BDSF3-8]|uniref:thiol-disulfide oxidoreductase DCC family protein n=1 Tax=Roseivirga sp. BDSF3-8 TaxID=3241598 RepID=UPI0035324214